jgi:hypothetical protein
MKQHDLVTLTCTIFLLCACYSNREQPEFTNFPPTRSAPTSPALDYPEPYIPPVVTITFAYPAPWTPNATTTAWEIQRATNIVRYLTQVAEFTATPTEIPLEGLQDCSPEQLGLEVGENGATGAILLGVSVIHRKGPACRLRTQISLTLLDKCGNLLPVEGNNQVIYLEASLQPGSPYNARGVTFIWRNWCGSRENYSWKVRAVGTGQEINDYTLFSAANCDSNIYPSRLYLEKRNYRAFGIPTIIPIGTATQSLNTSPTCVVTATPLATPRATRTALPTYSAPIAYP